MATFEIEHFFSIHTRELKKYAQFQKYQYYLGNITVCEVRFHLGGLKMPLWSLEDAFEAPQCYPGANIGSQNKCCCGWGKVKILLQK